jgi:hypothetical protein
LSNRRSDLVEALVFSLECTLLDDAEVSALIGRGEIDLASFERLLHVVPGAFRLRLQEAFGASSFTARLLPVKPEDGLYAYGGSPVVTPVAKWAIDRSLCHRLWSLATAVESRLRQMPDAARRENRSKIADGLGRFIGQLDGHVAEPLRRTSAELGVAIDGVAAASGAKL